ncbi:hypothetical protein ACLK1U_06185 [Escherichia coli]
MRDNESLSLSASDRRRSAEREHPGSSRHCSCANRFLPAWNEKRSAVNAIETRQDGVRCVIVPNDQMETPHYRTCCACVKGKKPQP